MVMQILTPVLIFGVIGLIFGGGLALAAQVFAVKQDERIPAVRNALPGANCGGCGFPGCDALAASIVAGESPVNGCPVGGAAAAAAIANIMGEEASTGPEMAAAVLCHGTHALAPDRARYFGTLDCRAALNANGGTKGCRFGCIGYGSCVKSCKFDALSMTETGLPKVDKDKCTSCGACVITCPKDIIELVPKDQNIIVSCQNTYKGKYTKADCKVGCIACRLCVKVCPTGAVSVNDNLASIDYEKCIQCGLCVEKCPTHAINGVAKPAALEEYKKNHPEYEMPKPKAKVQS